MRAFKRRPWIFLVIPLLLTGVKGCSGYEYVVRTGDGKTIRFHEMIEDIRKVNLIFVGEFHDRSSHHEAQLEIIKALDRSGVPVAIGLEMFRADSQKELHRWVDGSSGEDEFVKVYQANWTVPWPFYKDIFLYARQRRIPMIGLNVPDKITRKVSRQGFSSLGSEDLKDLPPGISCDIDEGYMQFIQRAYSAHRTEGKSFVHFCEAQMVWDKAMAWNLMEFLKGNPQRTVVVLAGTGHSWKRAIPGQVERLSGPPYRVILPEVPGLINPRTVHSHDADYILLE
jgi:uncharacterized iron-regulated protein